MITVNLEILSNKRKYFSPEPIDTTLVPMAGDYININVIYYAQVKDKLTEHKYTLINALVTARIFHLDSNTIQLRIRE